MSADWWDLVPAALGAVLGAAAAAIPAYCLARKGSKESLERDRTARREQQEADAIGALVKLVAIVHGVTDLHDGIEGVVAEAEQEGLGHLPLWCRVQGMLGLKDDEIRFEARELAVLVAANEFDYLASVMLVAQRYAELVAALQEYANLWRALTIQLPARMEGGGGTFDLTEEDQVRFGSHIAQLEMQIVEIRERAAEDSAEAAEVARQFGPIVRKQLGLAGFPVLSVPKGADTEASPGTA
jgi:hypothetical protein